MFSFFKRLKDKPVDTEKGQDSQAAKSGAGDLRALGSADNTRTREGVETVSTTLGLSQMGPITQPGGPISKPMLNESDAKRALEELPDPLDLLELDEPESRFNHSQASAKSAAEHFQSSKRAELDSSFDKLMADENDANDPIAVNTPFYKRLRAGLKRTGENITSLFVGTQIDEGLFEDLEGVLLMADAGTSATQFLLDDLKQRVKLAKTRDPVIVRGLLEQAIADLLKPLEAPLAIGHHIPTVMMVAGVNGAGKTTTIGKLTHHFQSAGLNVILAAGDTFRAAAREQLAVWADRNKVTIISRNEADPASVIFDAVQSGLAKKADVVIADTAGRLPTQIHLMEELKKIQRTISKAMHTAPHEVVLVIDGNTGQNALAQVKAFDEALGLTGLVVTKLDGTARGGVLCGIARYAATQAKRGKLPVYFIGVGEKLEDLQPFNGAQFAKALIG